MEGTSPARRGVAIATSIGLLAGTAVTAATLLSPPDTARGAVTAKKTTAKRTVPTTRTRRSVKTASALTDTKAPTTPTGLTQTLRTASKIGIRWTASRDNVRVAYYSIFVDGAYYARATTASYTEDGLSCGERYSVQVQAVDAAGNRSAKSTALTVSTTVCDATPPTAPGWITKTGATDTSIAVAWGAATDNSGSVRYAVYRDGTKVADTSATTATVGGLSCGTLYGIAVAAVDAAGNTSARTGATMATAACPAPAPAPLPVGDTTSPAVAISGIADGQTLTSAATVTAAATDAAGVAKVEFRVDGALKATDTSAPYTHSLDPSTMPAGGHTVTATAYDPSSNTGSAQRTFQVASAPSTTGQVVELSGTVSASTVSSRISGMPSGAVTVRPAAGATATVSGSFSPPRAGVTLDGLTFTEDVTFGPGDTGGKLLNSRARQFNIFGADDVVIRGNRFDGLGQTPNNQIWDEPAGSVPERYVIQNNTFTRFYGPTSDTHSEALYIGYSANGLVEGNDFTDNGTTAHVFFTWWGSTANSATSYPRNVCVRGNTFGPWHGAYYDINFRAEIPTSSGIAVDPGQGALSTSPAFTRSCS
ncbi:MAG: Ig-like domain-containing protein [Actinomycetota bacterium]